ncbi:MAG: hypothetical protein ACQET5_10835 [Halobacteriota archaeon]|uniref:hypothetical protein n=1 Tax=Natronomonas sp. TaxID=2184060 RepID=UPI00397587A7
MGEPNSHKNTPTLEETTDWIDADGDPLEHERQSKLFIGDEFSSVGDGDGNSGYSMRENMRLSVFKMRKYDGLLIYLAHDESSIHPPLWRVVVITKKTWKKQAIVADKSESGELRHKRFRIDGTPWTDRRYNSKDPSVWSWVGDRWPVELTV